MISYKELNSVCLYVCTNTAEEPIDRFASNFDKEARLNVVLSLVKNSKLEWFDFYGNLSFQAELGYYIILLFYFIPFLQFFYNIFL